MLKIRERSIQDLQDEVRALVTRGLVGRQARIYQLSRFFSDRKWQELEQLLSENNYLLRDVALDLVGKESWEND